jgi:hypothetical protein
MSSGRHIDILHATLQCQSDSQCAPCHKKQKVRFTESVYLPDLLLFMLHYSLDGSEQLSAVGSGSSSERSVTEGPNNTILHHPTIHPSTPQKYSIATDTPKEVTLE